MIFGGKDQKAKAQPPRSTKAPFEIETIVGPNTSLKGDIRSSGGVRIDGDFGGTIELAGNLIVGENATVVANILDQTFIVRSEFNGIVEVLYMFLSALVLGIIGVGRRSWIFWLFSVLLLGLAVVGSYWGFTVHTLWFEPLFPILLILVLTLTLQIVSLRSPAIEPDEVEVIGSEAVNTMTAAKTISVATWTIININPKSDHAYICRIYS